MGIEFSGGEGLHERMKSLTFLPIIESEVIRGIRENVSHGLDGNGNAMAPYTNAYKTIRLHKGLPVTPVNLRVKAEDSLLDTLGARKIDENNSEISVREDKERVAEGLSNKRRFMGVSPSTVVRIEQRLDSEFVRMMQ